MNCIAQGALQVTGRVVRCRSDGSSQSNFARQPVRGKLRLARKHRWCRHSLTKPSPLLGATPATHFNSAVSAFVWRSTAKGRANTRLCTSALFERFTEQAIKGVVSSQREAKSMGAHEVGLNCSGRLFSLDTTGTDLTVCRLNQNTCY